MVLEVEDVVLVGLVVVVVVVVEVNEVVAVGLVVVIVMGDETT